MVVICNLYSSYAYNNLCYLFVALLVRFSELTPATRNASDGENSEFTCNLLGGSNNISITSEWSITLDNGTTIEISGNSSDNFILLPPHNSRLIIVRHDRVFDQATVTCMGSLNSTGINAQLLISGKCIYVHKMMMGIRLCTYS